MDFVFGFDEGFVMPTGVAMRSLDYFLRAEDRIVALHLGIRPESAEAIGACVTNASIEFHDCSGRLDPAWVPPDYLSSAAFLRYLAPEILQSSDRCVYLDGDVVVRRDPRDLHDMDLSGMTIGATRSRVAPFAASPGGIRRWREAGIPSTAPGFNNGVLLIDLARWRSKDITGSMTRFLQGAGRDAWNPDQEALNAAVVDDWLHIDMTWNYITHVADSFLQQPEIEPTDPHIVHFAGRSKPWSNGRQPIFTEDWYKALESTPWRNFEPTEPRIDRSAKAVVGRAAARSIRSLRSRLNKYS